jgi:hypothetical protein
MSQRDKQAIIEPFAMLCNISEASKLSMPLIVMDVELRWKFKCP